MLWQNDKAGQFRHILLTGPPGCGKTTLVRKVSELLKESAIPVYGFYTEEVRSGGRRQGFDVVTLEGVKTPLARVIDNKVGSSSSKFMVGQYAVDKTSFETTVLPLLSYTGKGVAVIDEIGKMELFSRDFQQLVKAIFIDPKRVVLATIPIRPLPFVDIIRKIPSTKIITVEGNNRNQLPSDIVNLITASFSS